MATSKRYDQTIVGQASMNTNIIHVGLDVDDTHYHGSALDNNTGEVIEFKCRPTEGIAWPAEKLSQYSLRCVLNLCYVAYHIGSIQPLTFATGRNGSIPVFQRQIICEILNRQLSVKKRTVGLN